MGQFLSNCSVDSLALAAQALKDGSLVIFPTETVYGLGADATNEAAVARIYEVKGRPSDHPLIVHIADLKYLDEWISEIPEYAIKLARKFWPGPMTLILMRSQLAKEFITGGQETVGIRIPDNSLALGLLDAFHAIGGSGIAAPSANRFGQVSPTAAAAAQLFSQPIRIIDDKNVGYLISSYQFAYKRIGITEDEVTGKISPQSEIVANRFYSAILPLVWQNNIKETLQKGEELYFFDIVVISSAGFRFYAPDLKITIL